MILGTLCGCIEPTELIEVPAHRAVVVDAALTNLSGRHPVTLSYSSAISDTEFLSINDAQVEIINLSSNQTHDYLHHQNGQYLAREEYSAMADQDYQLRIVLANGMSYESDAVSLPHHVSLDSIYGQFIDVQATDSIDQDRGIQFLAHSSIPEKPFFLRYEWREAFRIRVPYPSLFVWDFDLVEPAPRGYDISVCYQVNNSSKPILATSAGLSGSEVEDIPVTFAHENGVRLLEKYHLLVRQYSITEDAYRYYKNLNDNNYGAGGLADSQKGMFPGNIHPANSQSLPVLGYLEIATISERERYFYPYQFVKEGFLPTFPCDPNDNADTLLHDSPPIIDEFQLMNSSRMIVDSIPAPYWPLGPAWAILPQTCCDCRNFGSLEKPDFWE